MSQGKLSREVKQAIRIFRDVVFAIVAYLDWTNGYARLALVTGILWFVWKIEENWGGKNEH